MHMIIKGNWPYLKIGKAKKGKKNISIVGENL